MSEDTSSPRGATYPVRPLDPNISSGSDESRGVEDQPDPKRRKCEETGEEDERQQEDDDVEPDQLPSEDEEVRPFRFHTPPTAPTFKERLEHELTHLPFRSWCPFCVMGKARSNPHKTVEEDLGTVATFCMDYFFLKDENSEDTCTCIAMRERYSKTQFSHVVPHKGAGVPEVMRMLVDDIRSLGLGDQRVILKVDQERALGALAKAMTQHLPQAIVEDAKLHDSASHGTAERGVQMVEEQIRTHLLALNAQLGGQLSIHHPVVSWLVEYASFTLNRALISNDGRTAFERVRGKRYKGDIFPFGSVVLAKHPGRPRGGNMNARWFKGVWLGKSPKSDEHYVGDAEGVHRVRSVRPVPVPETWNLELVDAIRERAGGFKDQDSAPGDSDGPQVIPAPEPRAEEKMPDTPMADPVPRSIHIQKQHLDRWGYSEGCPKCMGMLEKRRNDPDLRHSAACRSRVYGKMKEDPEWKERFEQKEQRKREYLHKEADDDGAPAPPEQPEGAEKTPTSENIGPQGANSEDKEVIPDNLGEKAEMDVEPQASASSRLAGRLRRERSSEDPEFVQPQNKRVRLGGEEQEEGRPPSCFEQSDSEESSSASSSSSSTSAPAEELPANRAVLAGEDSGTSKYDLCEVCSVPRITSFASDLGLKAGWSIDIRAPDSATNRTFDLTTKADRAAVLRLVREDCPRVIIGSPPCRLFSRLQWLSQQRDWEKYYVELEEAKEMMAFLCLIYKMQLKRGAYFIHEHPTSASSWKLDCIMELLMLPGVGLVRFDMCRYGMTSQDSLGEAPVHKPTTLMSNCEAVLNSVNQRCEGGHRHVELIGGRAKACEKYPDALCEAIARAVDVQLRSDDQGEAAYLQAGAVNLHIEDDCGDFVFEDDVKGGILDSTLVKQARAEEMQEFENRGVYIRLRREDAKKRGMTRTIKTRWVDTNKGSVAAPQIRSRLVAKQIAYKSREDLYAATPSLEAFKVLLSILVAGAPQGKRMAVVDIKKAFLYADVEGEDIYIELPEEDKYSGGEYVGLLCKSMYGTRKAPQNWANYLERILKRLGFKPGLSNPCVFNHKSRDIKLCVHVDDFAIVAGRSNLQWIIGELRKEFTMNYSILGDGPGEVSEIEYLHRKIKWTTAGVVYTPSEKHVDRALAAMDMGTSKPITTPGTGDDDRKSDDAQPLEGLAATRYRQTVATLNYLSQDRADISFAVKKVAQRMAHPRVCDVVPLKRILRYLRMRPVMETHFSWQSIPAEIVGYTDSDWGSCLETRRSTSGGLVKLGGHCVKHWSRTQAAVSLSTAEAELYSLVKGATECLGIQALLRDWGFDLQVSMRTDASAARSICMKRGVGRTKHVEIQSLWIQDCVRLGKLRIDKISREKNAADALTHHWSAAEGQLHFPRMALQPAREASMKTDGTAVPCPVYRVQARGGAGCCCSPLCRV